MSDSDESGPPDVQHGDQVAADANAPTHPVWAAAAGRSAPNKPNSMFAPISMMELELRGRGDLDGASSTASSRGAAKKKKARPRDYDDDDDSEPDLAGAAFGGKRKCGSEVSDDALSITSADRRAAHKRAFPVSGVTCVGCALPAKVAPVNEFIQKNMSTMSELALFKMAALLYQTKVAEPAIEEGVTVPQWNWKDLRSHYTLHTVDPKFQRFENIRTLAAMRKTLELQLLRVDSETGEQSLDKQNAESILKIITASSRELTLLHDATSVRKK